MITEGDELMWVWRVSWATSKDQCYFGVESAAKAYAGELGRVEKLAIPRRDFKVVPASDLKDEHHRYVGLWDRTQGTPCEQIRWQQERDELSAQICADIHHIRSLWSLLQRSLGSVKAEAERDHDHYEANEVLRDLAEEIEKLLDRCNPITGLLL